MSTPTVAVRSQSSADWAAYHAASPAAAAAIPIASAATPGVSGWDCRASCSGSRGRLRWTPLVATRTEPDSTPALASVRSAVSSSPRGVCSRGMPATPVWAAYSRATSTDVAPSGTTRSSTPAGPCTLTAMVEASAWFGCASVTTSPMISSAPDSTGDVQASRWCAAHLSSTRPFGYG